MAKRPDEARKIAVRERHESPGSLEIAISKAIEDSISNGKLRLGTDTDTSARPSVPEALDTRKGSFSVLACEGTRVFSRCMDNDHWRLVLLLPCKRTPKLSCRAVMG